MLSGSRRQLKHEVREVVFRARVAPPLLQQGRGIFVHMLVTAFGPLPKCAF
jgi:hypothetical protein